MSNRSHYASCHTSEKKCQVASYFTGISRFIHDIFFLNLKHSFLLGYLYQSTLYTRDQFNLDCLHCREVINQFQRCRAGWGLGR